MNKILSILLACTAAGAAYGAQETAQETGQAAKNVAIDSVVVTGARYASDIRHLPMSVAVVDRDEIVRRQEASVLPLLTEQVPGLFVTGRGVMGYGVSDGAAGGISLRGIGGGSAAQMLVLIDGHPQYMGLFGHPIADAYQSMLAERVEVVRGPASVLYGSNAMGGVINIVTRRQREEGVKTDLNVGYGSWNTLQTEAANRIRKGRFTSVVTGSYNRTDGHRADMGFEQYGGYAKVGYEISRRWNAYADVNLTHFNASNPGEITAPVFDNDSRITRGMASVSLENSYDRTSGALKFFYNWGRHRINDGYGAGEEPRDYRFNSKDRMLGVSWYQSAGLWRGSRLTAGIDWQRFGGRAWNRFTADGREEPIVDQTEDEIAGYADFRQSLGRLTVDAGVRIDHHTRTGTEWVPQAGISLRAARDGALKAMVSKGFRNPVLRELYMFGVKNPDLKPERLWNYELSWTQRLAGGSVSYGVNLFYIEGEDIIRRGRADGRNILLNQARIENWGAEADAAWRIGGGWSVNANYSWLRMEYPVPASPEHKLYAGGDFGKGRWSVSTGVQYIAGLREEILSGSKDKMLVVLHTSTSHGPTYYKKYPPEFEVFSPVCTTVEMSKADPKELMNAYDNTIVYTDYLIHSVIEILRGIPQRRSCVIFVSDHGESLGEGNLYMHGVPILVAPKEQIEIPFIVWTSDEALEIDPEKKVGQYHVFHSVLSFLGIDSPIYDESLDIFQPPHKR